MVRFCVSVCIKLYSAQLQLPGHFFVMRNAVTQRLPALLAIVNIIWILAGLILVNKILDNLSRLVEFLQPILEQ